MHIHQDITCGKCHCQYCPKCYNGCPQCGQGTMIVKISSNTSSNQKD